jgi:hypothetical protein
MLAGCASRTLPEHAKTPSLELLGVYEQSICWAGVCLGDSRETVEKKLGLRLQPKEDYTDVCGEFFSNAFVAGRSIRLQWDSVQRDSELESITVPLSASEIASPEAELSRAARKAIPSLVDGVAIEYNQPAEADPLYLVLASNHELAINIKPDGPEKFFTVIYAGCID